MSSAEHLRLLATRLAPADGIDRHDLELLTVPDTVAARSAEEICREAQSETLANHCFRSYAWGALLGNRDGLDWDPELLYVAAMLHDLGLTPAYDRGGCFEQDGADAARELLAELGWEATRAETVAEAIYLHMHETGPENTPEAQLLDLGTAVDVRGVRIGDVPASPRSFVLDRFPRIGFKEHFLELLTDQADRKPQCIAHAFVYERHAAEHIRTAPFDS
ncbi:MAG TPA: HD domain-containing protein [Gaiellaceae bacterium]|nr:HD domain-containing protein [Gaiellaceae bacterium]